jgi:hypothetical protein
MPRRVKEMCSDPSECLVGVTLLAVFSVFVLALAALQIRHHSIYGHFAKVIGLSVTNVVATLIPDHRSLTGICGYSKC